MVRSDKHNRWYRLPVTKKNSVGRPLASERYSMSVALRIKPRVAGVLPQETDFVNRIANNARLAAFSPERWEVFVIKHLRV